jgi:hypothetical protein
MPASQSRPVFAITFAAAYAILYLLAVENNWALFTYHPLTGEFHWLITRAAEGPSMFWYGWMATAALGGLAIAAGVSFLPGAITGRLSVTLSWAVPLATMFAFAYIMRDFFFR